jgi:serine/threonine-protein kinase
MSGGTAGEGVPEVGELLAGKYRVERVIGAGGMGVVLAAMHVHLEERVAIKLIKGATDQEAVQRFLREGKAAVKIRSEHVARVLDVGTLDTGSPYMVMEYLEGGDLSSVLRRQGPLPIPVAVAYLLQACEALAQAHILGIVHRDLKPANLFLTYRVDGSPCVKVLDFGISKTQVASDMALTKTSAVLGSPLYMSPEQMRSTRSVDARADIWALGTILHELLSGKTPFSATTMTELCSMIIQDAPPPLGTLRPDVPPPLATAVLRCLEKDPVLRYANVAELALAIADYGPSEARTSVERVMRILRVPAASASRVLAAAPPPQAATMPLTPLSLPVTAANWGDTRDPRPRSSAGVAVAVGVAALVGIVGVGVVGVTVIAPALQKRAHTQPTSSESSPAAGRSVEAEAPEPASSTLPTLVPSATSSATVADRAPTPPSRSSSSNASPASSASAVHTAAPVAKAPVPSTIPSGKGSAAVDLGKDRKW